MDLVGRAGASTYDEAPVTIELLDRFKGWGESGGPSEGMSTFAKAANTIGQMSEAAAGGSLAAVHNFVSGAAGLFGLDLGRVDSQEALAKAATFWTSPVQSILGPREKTRERIEKQLAGQQRMRDIAEDSGGVSASLVKGSEIFGDLLGLVSGPQGAVAGGIGSRISRAVEGRIARSAINTVEKAALSLEKAEDAIDSATLLKTAIEATGRGLIKKSPDLSAKLTETMFKWAPEITGQAIGWGIASSIGAEEGERLKSAALGAVMAIPMVITGRLGNYVENAMLKRMGAPDGNDVKALSEWIKGNPSRGQFARLAAGAVEGLAFPLLAQDLEAYAPIVHATLNGDVEELQKALIVFGIAGPLGNALMRGLVPSQIPFYRARNRILEHRNFENAIAEAAGIGGKLREKRADIANIDEARAKAGEEAADEGARSNVERASEAESAKAKAIVESAENEALMAGEREASFLGREKEAGAFADANVKAGASQRSAVPPAVLNLVDSGWSLTSKVARNGEGSAFEIELPGVKQKIGLRFSNSGEFEITVPHDLFAEMFPGSSLLGASKEAFKFQGDGAEAISKAIALRSNTDAAMMRMFAEKLGLEPSVAGIFTRADGSLATFRFGKLYDSVDGGQTWFLSDQKVKIPNKKNPPQALSDASGTLKRVVRAIEMGGDFTQGPDAALVKRALESLDAAASMIRNGSAKDPFVLEAAALVSDPAFMATLSRMRDADDLLDVAHEVMATAAGFSTADKSLERVLGVEKAGNDRRAKRAEQRAQQEQEAMSKAKADEDAATLETKPLEAEESVKTEEPTREQGQEQKPKADSSKNTKEAIQAVSKFEEESTWARKRKRDGTLEASRKAYDEAKAAADREGVPSPLRILLEKPWSLRRGQPNPDVSQMERLDALKRFAAAERVDQSTDRVELTNDRVANLLGVDRGTVAKYRKDAKAAQGAAVAEMRKEAALAADKKESPAAWFDSLPKERQDIVAKAMNERESSLDRQMMAEGGSELQAAWRDLTSALKAEAKRLGSAAPAFAFFGEGHTAPTAIGLGMAAMSYFGYRFVKNVDLGKKVWTFTKLAYEKAIAPIVRNVGTIVREWPMAGISRVFSTIDRILKAQTKASLAAIGALWNTAIGKIRDLKNRIAKYAIEHENTPSGGIARMTAGAMQVLDWSMRRSPTAILKLTRDKQAQKSEGERESALISNKLFAALGDDPHVDGSKSFELVRAIQGKQPPPPGSEEVYQEAKALFADLAQESLDLGMLTPERIIEDYYPQGRGASAKDLAKALRANPDIAAQIGSDAAFDPERNPFMSNVMSTTSEQVVAGGVKTAMANMGPFMRRERGVLDPAQFKSDPRTLIPRNIIAQRTAHSFRRMFNKIAADSALAVSSEVEARRLWGEAPGAYKQVRAETNGEKLFLGPLDGMFVHPSVHELTKRTRFWRNDFMEVMSVLTSLVKRAMVTANPMSYVRQEMSQTFVMSTIGVHGKWNHEQKAWAEEQIRTNGEWFRELSDAGQIGTEFAVEQIINDRSSREAIYDLASGQDRGLFYKAVAKIDDLLRSPSKLGAVASGVENAYSKSDVLAKLIAYRDLKDRVGKEEAIERVASLYNYQEMAPIMSHLGSFFWFQRFNYMVARSALKYGTKTPFSSLATTFAYAWAVRQLFSMLTGETEDDKRNSAEIAGHGLSAPAFEQFVLPLYRENGTGRMAYLDLTMLNPMEGAARWTGLLSSPYGSGTLSNPFLDMGNAVYSAVRGVDPKLPGGKVFEESSGMLTRLGMAAAYSLQQMAPSVSGIPMMAENVRSLGTSERESGRRINKSVERMASPVPIVDSDDQAGIYASQAKNVAKELADLKADRFDAIRGMRDKLSETAGPKEKARLFKETSDSLVASGFAPLSTQEATSAVLYSQLKTPVARALFSSGGGVQFTELEALLDRGSIGRTEAQEVFKILKASPAAARQAILDYGLLNGIPVEVAAEKVRGIIAKLREINR